MKSTSKRIMVLLVAIPRLPNSLTPMLHFLQLTYFKIIENILFEVLSN